MQKQDFLAEAGILKRLQHPHLIRLFGVCTQMTPDAQPGQIMILTELMTQGSLLTFLQKRAGPCAPIPNNLVIPLEMILDFASQVVFLFECFFVPNFYCLTIDNYYEHKCNSKRT